jgi:hypothetical protein
VTVTDRSSWGPPDPDLVDSGDVVYVPATEIMAEVWCGDIDPEHPEDTPDTWEDKLDGDLIEVIRDPWQGQDIPPVVLYLHPERGWMLGDGHHRVAACAALGIEVGCVLTTDWDVVRHSRLNGEPLTDLNIGRRSGGGRRHGARGEPGTGLA